jgi:gamma-glutamylcyclotransferase (GGCT)/AIG2-like uncharacterized protein YtfP
MIALFSYGTLQQPEVQLATYGRLLEGAPDVLPGYRLEKVLINDPRVVGLSGREVHTIACLSDDAADRIAGVVFYLSEAELEATDGYETSAYARMEVTLESGRKAWVYAAPPAPTEKD